ncbi:MAG: T9SS type A sorting domain-containing protein, partial [Burkholderiales bacterium]|nr:T9SS type A sorting domain-containing protein [Bacteroidia bacterium]
SDIITYPNDKSSLKIDVGSITKGIYILEIESGNKIYYSKLIILPR